MLEMLTGSSDEESGTEEEEVPKQLNYIEQIGGAPKKRGRVEGEGGFKPVSGYSNKRQRCRLIQEEIRSSETRITTSDLSPVFDDIVACYKKSLTTSETSNTQSILKLFSQVGDRELSDAVGALGSNNNVAVRFAYLCDMLFGDADNILTELKTLIKTVEALKLRYMEGVLVNLWGDTTGNISWTELYSALSQIPNDRVRRIPRSSRGVGSDDPLGGGGGENDDDDDDDDDGKGAPKYFNIGDTSTDVDMLPYVNELPSATGDGGGGGAAPAPKKAGRPKKSATA